MSANEKTSDASAAAGIPDRIVSGGQTGADRAALDAAIAHGVPHGGWCPKGRRAEDGPIDERYELIETESKDYPVRTERNVVDSDGTVIFSIAATLTGGSKMTGELAKRHGKPWLHLPRASCSVDEAAAELRRFVAQHSVRTLNVAGPRASGEPEIAGFVREVLDALLVRT